MRFPQTTGLLSLRWIAQIRCNRLFESQDGEDRLRHRYTGYGHDLHRDFPGTVHPNENKRAEIRPLVRGRVVDVYVGVGQDVNARALLAMLYSRELGLAQSSYLKARTRFHEAEQAFERVRDLLNSKAIRLAEFQKREAELLGVRAETRKTRDRLKG